MRSLFYVIFILVSFCGNAFSETLIHEKLYAALQLNKIALILHEEGIDDGVKTGAVYLGQDYDKKGFRAAIDKIYNLKNMENNLMLGLVKSLSLDTATHVLDFFRGDLGRKIATLETSARTAISDSAVERIAIDIAKAAKNENSERYNLLEKNVADMGFVEFNMKGAFSAQFAFLSELSKLDIVTITNDEIFAMLMENEAEMRTEIMDWLMGFSYMAYKPLSDEDLDVYIAFLNSSYGKELNNVLFGIFNMLSAKNSEGLANTIVAFYTSRDL